jgi:hypothetical protein
VNFNFVCQHKEMFWVWQPRNLAFWGSCIYIFAFGFDFKILRLCATLDLSFTEDIMWGLFEHVTVQIKFIFFLVDSVYYWIEKWFSLCQTCYLTCDWIPLWKM